MKYVSSDGFQIYVGRNNIQNDYLTFRIAEKTDIWLHTLNIPGSHVILKTNGEMPTDTALGEAAQLAAFYSKASDSSQVPVSYTAVKNVKKPSGAKPGFVIFSNSKTAFVTPKQI
jgi:predicted ribosome quality control (RQC) complex YloA/Tae2 family protein